jgi:acyl carrier protein
MSATVENDLTLQIKEYIIKYLNLIDMSPDDIGNDDQLFGEKFGLDSIDALELSVMIEREYGIKITDPKEGRKVLMTVDTMAQYIQENRPSA